jgi:hypothetical protein
LVRINRSRSTALIWENSAAIAPPFPVVLAPIHRHDLSARCGSV